MKSHHTSSKGRQRTTDATQGNFLTSLLNNYLKGLSKRGKEINHQDCCDQRNAQHFASSVEPKRYKLNAEGFSEE